MTEESTARVRTASCSCVDLTVTASGEPLDVYLCGCLNCQRETGSSFTYAAVFPETAVSITGAQKLSRRRGESGRWVETAFCPTCGSTVYGRMESWPGVITVSAGCFADPAFAEPATLYWAARCHRWLEFPEGIRSMDSQPA